MTTKLDEIAAKARSDKKLRFTSLAHLITPGFLKETWMKVNRRGAAGVDRETTGEFEAALDERIESLYDRVRCGAYRPPPVRRVEIPKGKGKTRPLGIPTVEDRLLQAAVARILSAVYEENFLDVSFGYRPRRSAHDALRTLRGHLIGRKVMHIYEADIASYFDRVNHDWLKRMLNERIVDRSILRLVHRWLRAGVMDGGIVVKTEQGVPQGGPISPLLANVYLHYSLDLWFEKVVRKHCHGIADQADKTVKTFAHVHWLAPSKDAPRLIGIEHHSPTWMLRCPPPGKSIFRDQDWAVSERSGAGFSSIKPGWSDSCRIWRRH